MYILNIFKYIYFSVFILVLGKVLVIFIYLFILFIIFN